MRSVAKIKFGRMNFEEMQHKAKVKYSKHTPIKIEFPPKFEILEGVLKHYPDRSKLGGIIGDARPMLAKNDISYKSFAQLRIKKGSFFHDDLRDLQQKRKTVRITGVPEGETKTGKPVYRVWNLEILTDKKEVRQMWQDSGSYDVTDSMGDFVDYCEYFINPQNAKFLGSLSLENAQKIGVVMFEYCVLCELHDKKSFLLPLEKARKKFSEKERGLMSGLVKKVKIDGTEYVEGTEYFKRALFEGGYLMNRTVNL